MNRLHEDHSEGIYQIRRKNWNVLFGGTETQAVYERMSHAEIIKKLKKGVGDFEKIIEALAYHRWCLALGLNHKNSVFFGEERQVHLITGFKGRYDEYGQRLFTLDSTKNAPYLMDVKKTQHTIRGQFVVKIEEKLIPLTRFNYNNSIQNGKWFHTSPEYFNDLTPFIEGLYENILAMKEPTLVELSHAIGFFHWYFTHLTLYNRGSSSITDQTTKLLWAYHSFRVTPWKEGVIPDCEALSTPNPDEFAQNYLNLMENAPYKDKRILSSSLNMKVALLVNLAKNFQLHQLEALLPELVANYLKCQLTKILDVIKNSTKCVTSN